LLRRYGHVDQVPLANGAGLGNPADVVEIRADLVMSSVEQKIPEHASPRSSERVDWWLEEGGDECITLYTCHFEGSDRCSAVSSWWATRINCQKR
jgi:SET domain-containing protein 6